MGATTLLTFAVLSVHCDRIVDIRDGESTSDFFYVS
jgi:hypothetical protein